MTDQARARFGSVFAGIGGIDRGLELAGMECRWQIEINPYRQRVLARHWPDVKRYGDIREVDFEQVEWVDLIAGGHPCQPDSLAGQGRGEHDERWLWPEFARAVREVRPRYVLVENPPGILRRGGGMRHVLGDLAALGYDAEWTVLSAAQFGAPHIRERVFILAYAHGIEWPERWCEPARQVSQATAYADGQHGVPRVGPWSPERPILLRDPGERSRFWLAAADVAPGMDDGVPDRVERRAALGDSVVPQVADWIGRRILERERA